MRFPALLSHLLAAYACGASGHPQTSGATLEYTHYSDQV